MRVNQIVKGDCESCSQTNVILYTSPHGIQLCVTCTQLENEAIRNQIQSVSQRDEVPQTKEDLFLAERTPMIALRGMIDADTSIQPTQKDYEYARLCQERMQQMQSALFEVQRDLNKKISLWKQEVQITAGRLTGDQLEKFKSLDVNYQPPVQPQSARSSKPTGSQKGKSYDGDAVGALAKKYGMKRSMIQMAVTTKGSIDAADKYLASLLSED